MITCPAIVPTAEDDSPEASSAMPKSVEAAPPTSGVSVLNAVSMLPTSLCPLLKKTAAAMITIAPFTSPARPSAIQMSSRSKRKMRCASSALRGRMRPCVSAECR